MIRVHNGNLTCVLETFGIVAAELDKRLRIILLHSIPLIISILVLLGHVYRNNLIINVPLLLELVQEVFTVLHALRRRVLTINRRVRSDADEATDVVGGILLIYLDHFEHVAIVGELAQEGRHSDVEFLTRLVA